jgi:hypothetical protein
MKSLYVDEAVSIARGKWEIGLSPPRIRHPFIKTARYNYKPFMEMVC